MGHSVSTSVPSKSKITAASSPTARGWPAGPRRANLVTEVAADGDFGHKVRGLRSGGRAPRRVTAWAARATPAARASAGSAPATAAARKPAARASPAPVVSTTSAGAAGTETVVAPSVQVAPAAPSLSDDGADAGERRHRARRGRRPRRRWRTAGRRPATRSRAAAAPRSRSGPELAASTEVGDAPRARRRPGRPRRRRGSPRGAGRSPRRGPSATPASSGRLDRRGRAGRRWRPGRGAWSARRRGRR